VHELVAPAKKVAPCAGGLDAENAELGAAESEEGGPVGDFGGVGGEGAADQGEEGGDVGDKGGGGGDWRCGDASVEVADVVLVLVEAYWFEAGDKGGGLGMPENHCEG